MKKLLVASMLVIGCLIAWLFVSNSAEPAVARIPDAASTEAAAIDVRDDRLEVSAIGRIATDREVRAESAENPLPRSTDGLRRIAGRVVDVDRHAPVPGCRVDFLQSGRSHVRVLTNEDGRFESDQIFEPGLVSVRNLPVMEGAEADLQWTIQPAQFAVDEASDPSRPFEIELVGTPRLGIEIEVRKPFGDVPKKANVYASSLILGDLATEGELSFAAILSCDARGRSTIWVSREFSQRCALKLRATDEESVAPAVVVEPPLTATPIVLMLGLGSNVHIRVVDARKAPVPGASIDVSEISESSGSIGYFEKADDSGTLTLSGVPPGRFDVSAADRPTRRSKTQHIEVVQGQDIELEIELPDADLQLALRGRAIDEHGNPLAGVDVRVFSPTEDEFARSDENGLFEARMLRTDELQVEVGARELDDIFEPALSRVAFGTTDFVVRRVRKIERTELVIRLVDRDTKRTIHAPRVYTARRAYSDATQWLSRNGLTKVTITDRESGWILFAARGYRPVPKPIGMLRATSSPSDILTIELERGFERPLTFVDSETHAQLAGVAVIAPSGETQLSDSEGKVWLRAREWPPPYRVVLHGYKTIHWDPNASPDWKRVVQLELDPTVPR